MAGLVVVAVSREPPAPPSARTQPAAPWASSHLYKMGSSLGEDVQVSGSDGLVSLRWQRPGSDAPQGDVIRSGPPGSLLLQYVAVRVRSQVVALSTCNTAGRFTV